MTTDAQTQGIPRLPAAVLSATEPEVGVAPDATVEDARTESIEELYEVGLAKLSALHDRWAAAVAEIRGAQPTAEPREAAA